MLTLKIILATPILMALLALFICCGLLAVIAYGAVRAGFWIVERLLVSTSKPAPAVGYEY